MKKIISVILSFLLVAAPAFADPDFSSMSTDDLLQLRNTISLELASRIHADDALAIWDTSLAHVELLSIRRGVTNDGTPGVDLVFSYTNMGTEVGNFRSNHWVVLYHDGVECERIIYLDGELVNNDTWGAKVLPGRTLSTMHWFFSLPGTEDTVDVEIEDRTGLRSKSAGIFTIKLPTD